MASAKSPISEMVDQLGALKFREQPSAEDQQKINLQENIEAGKEDADRELADGDQVFTTLRECINKCEEDHKQTVQDSQKSTEKHAKGLIKELEEEGKDLTKVEVPPLPSYEGTLRRFLDHLKETLDMEMKKLPDLKPAVKKRKKKKKLPDLRSTLKKYECELTLDPNTAHRGLALSKENRKATRAKEMLYPDHRDRFDMHLQVLCKEHLIGLWYWEVEVERKGAGAVGIGVTYRGITRIGDGNDSRLGRNTNSWSIFCHDDHYSVWYNNFQTDIDLLPSNRVGVYLDRPAGSLSFYRVSPDGGGFSDTLTLIHTFQSTFTQEDLLPGFGFWLGDDGSSVSLCRL